MHCVKRTSGKPSKNNGVMPSILVPPTQPGNESAAAVNDGIELHGPGDAVITL